MANTSVRWVIFINPQFTGIQGVQPDANEARENNALVSFKLTIKRVGCLKI